MKEKVIKIIREICRHHISLLMLITLIDLALLAADEPVTLCFGLLAPQRLLALGMAGQGMAGEASLLVCGWLTALICIGLFAVCLASSYNRPGWLICAAVMTLLDTALAVISLIAYSDSTYYLDIAAHAWCVAALVAAYILARRKPARKRKSLSSADVDKILELLSRNHGFDGSHNIDDLDDLVDPEEFEEFEDFEESEEPEESENSGASEEPSESEKPEEIEKPAE